MCRSISDMVEESGVSRWEGDGHSSGTWNVINSAAGSNKSTIKLFGATIATETSPASHCSLASPSPLTRSSSLDSLGNPLDLHHVGEDAGYLSDGPCVLSKRARSEDPSNRGKPWTEQEHRTFLAGLKLVGRGHWREISKNFVTTKTPTQVASHAQKYFLRQTCQDKKKRRLSLFDIPFEEPSPAPLGNGNISSSQATCTTAQVMEKFPALCLDPRSLVLMQIPATVHGISAGMYSSPAYYQGPRFPGECDTRIPQVHGYMGKCLQLLQTHPSGIFPPCSNPSPAASRRVPRFSSPTEEDGLGLELGLPRDPEKDQLPSPTPGAGTMQVN